MLIKTFLREGLVKNKHASFAGTNLELLCLHMVALNMIYTLTAYR